MVKVDYVYYKDEFSGDLISENEFDSLIKKAEPYVSMMTFGNADGVDDSSEYSSNVMNALCSVAETIKSYTDDSGVEHGAISSESVGGVWSRSYSVDKDSSSKSMESAIKFKLYMYLSNTGLLYAGG